MYTSQQESSPTTVGIIRIYLNVTLEKNMTNIISVPITGNEDLNNLTTPYEALVQFYHAFNHQKIAEMSDNWLHGDEASMSNPLGDIKRGWLEISSVYNHIFNGARPRLCRIL